MRPSCQQVKGKIVVFNQPFRNYSHAAQYRKLGASKAAKHGAVAALIRSAATFSIGSPHTGQQLYEEGIHKIPAASLSVEDAMMLYRLYIAGMFFDTCTGGEIPDKLVHRITCESNFLVK